MDFTLSLLLNCYKKVENTQFMSNALWSLGWKVWLVSWSDSSIPAGRIFDVDPTKSSTRIQSYFCKKKKKSFLRKFVRLDLLPTSLKTKHIQLCAVIIVSYLVYEKAHLGNTGTLGQWDGESEVYDFICYTTFVIRSQLKHTIYDIVALDKANNYSLNPFKSSYQSLWPWPVGK